MDRHAIDILGVPAFTLMTRAGEAAFRVMRERWPRSRRVLVLCGAGNNAGDGYVVARLALAAGLDVTVCAVLDPTHLRNAAVTAYQDYRTAGGEPVAWDPALLAGCDLIVDAIFGTGLSRPLDSRLQACIAAINGSRKPVLALDVPSGLNADTGLPWGASVRADCTIAYVGLKTGFYLADGPAYTGLLVCDALGIPSSIAAAEGYAIERLTPAWLREVMRPRSRISHKGQFGHVVIVGGNYGMAGAIRLAGEACLRVGAGKVTLATRSEHVQAVLAGRPELMAHPADDRSDIERILEPATVVAVGPGLGQDDWAQHLLTACLAQSKPLVVDADALNLLAQRPEIQPRDAWILTPHPGEAGRLLGISSGHIHADRLGAAHRLNARFGATVVLKGAGTLVTRLGEVTSICDAGNPGMATAGMGDVLTGVIAGLAGQTLSLWDAARAGVLVHALAGDAAARSGERGLVASDLFDELRRCVNP